MIDLLLSIPIVHRDGVSAWGFVVSFIFVFFFVFVGLVLIFQVLLTMLLLSGRIRAVIVMLVLLVGRRLFLY